MRDGEKYERLAALTLDEGASVLDTLHAAAVELYEGRGRIVGGFVLVHVWTPDGTAAWGVLGVTPGYATDAQKAEAARTAAETLEIWADDIERGAPTPPREG